jgi:ABC-type dipeptide/oligopeptide/nickel transport system ATPase component
LLELSERDMRKIRGAEIGFIFQEPMTALNPVFTIDDQIAEALYTKALLSAIPLPDPDRMPTRITLTPKDVNLDAPLRELAPGHFAAV